MHIESEGWSNVTWFTWALDSRHLLFKTDLPGIYRGHMYLADMLNPEKAPDDLTPGTEINAIFCQNIHLDLENVLLSHNRRCRHCYDLYKVNLKTGRETLLAMSNNDVAQWICDRKGSLRGRIRVAGNQKQLDIFDPSANDWEQLIKWDYREKVRVQSFTSDQKGLWLLSNRGRDRLALTVLDIDQKKETVINEDPKVDLEFVFTGAKGGTPKAVLTYPDYPRIDAVDPEIKDRLSFFRADHPQGAEITGMNNDETVWTVKTFDDKGESYFLLYTETFEKVHIESRRVGAEENLLSDVVPIAINSRDGLPLRGYITLPKGAASMPLPMILLVHGGPWARSYWNYNKMVQFLTNRGYAVLQINFRGSTGYGLKFKEAAINEFGKKMHTDLLDAVQWAVGEEIADPGKIAIMGSSYGGYAALLGLTITPDVFACGISINGVSDVKAFLESLPKDPPLYRKPSIEMWYTYIGRPEDPELGDLFRERSPLSLSEKQRDFLSQFLRTSSQDVTFVDYGDIKK